MTQLASLILAAGKGTRMRSDRPKVLHQVAGDPMLFYPLQAADALGVSRHVCVLGHGQKDVLTCLEERAFKTKSPLQFVVQTQQAGTAHAVRQAESALQSFSGDVLILCGDVPLIRKQTLQDFVRFHRRNKYGLSVLTTELFDPTAYGRIIRDESNQVQAIVEELDATTEQKQIQEINAGIYLISKQRLFAYVKRIQKNPRKQEYYLTDIVTQAVAEGIGVGAFCIPDANEVLGVNTRDDLAQAHDVMLERLVEEWFDKGVNFLDPHSVLLDRQVKLAADVTIGPACVLRGHTVVKKAAFIDVGAVITDSIIGSEVRIKPYSVIEQSRVDRGAQVGPFAHLRPGTHLGPAAKVGNFVELKKASLGRGAKASHLAYLGDAVIGEDANIGAGTITCNYDGTHKHQTRVGPRVFIGSDTQLVAPVTLGADSWVGAGTTVTQDVPVGALALSRVKQFHIKGWSKRFKNRKKKV